MDASFAAGDLKQWTEYHHADVVYRNFNDGPYGGTWRGRGEYLRAMLGGITGGYDGDYLFRVLGYSEVADDLAAMHWAVTVTPSTGDPVTSRGCEIFRVEGGLVTEVYEITERSGRDLLPFLKPTTPA